MIEISSPNLPAVIEVEQLSRRFGDRQALCEVSLTIARGEVFGLIGANGAGKTTLMRHLLGLLKAHTGAVRVFGLDPVSHPVEVLGRIGYLSEDRDLPDWMRLRELMRYTRTFYPGWDDDFAEHLRETFDLDPAAKIRDLSRGQRARAGLLIALAHRPQLLLLDEPSSGLDPVVRRDILSAIIRTIADEGRTVVFSSHLLDEVERVADRIAIIHQGRLVLAGTIDEVKQTHRRLTVRFPQPSSEPPAVPGATPRDGSGDEWRYVCSGPSERLRRAVSEMGGQVVAEESLSLDDIFVDRVSSG